MLTWLVEEVESPYGGVATLHWAVPDEVSSADVDEHDHHQEDGVDFTGAHRKSLMPHTHLSTEQQVELESAADQLGAVLWNSNPAALRYLHRHVFAFNQSDEADSPSNLSSSPPLRGKYMVELGAGVGCLGIALAMAGARVAVTDLKELLPLMKHNVQLNAKRVRMRSGGVGQCAALPWKWGPSGSTGVHKQLVKATGRSPVESVLADMAVALVRRSDALQACTKALTGSTSPTPYHYVILCDALYGNPKDWPSLLYTLTELMATNPDECEAVNFCEQRVNDVEAAFLKLLDAENEKPYIPATDRDREGAGGDALWQAVLDTAQDCLRSDEKNSNCGGNDRPSSAAPASGSEHAHKTREEASKALLNYVLVQRRAGYRWTYTTEVVSEAQSTLNMVIRATRIRWAKASTGAVPAESRRRARTSDEALDASLTEKKKKSG